MREPPANICPCYSGNGLPQGTPERRKSPGLAFPQGRCDLRNIFFNRIQVWRISQEQLQACAGRFDQSSDLGIFMHRHLIPQDNVTRSQSRQEKVPHIEFQHFAINRTFYHHWNPDPVPGQRTDDRNVAARFKRFDHFRSLTPWGGTGIVAAHGQMNPEFIDNPEPRTWQLLLLAPEAGTFFGIGFAGAPGLFFRERSIFCKPRQIMLGVTFSRSRWLLIWQSSSNVASGWAATNSASFNKRGSSSLAVALPPCGRGFRSPLSRRCASSLYTYRSVTLKISAISAIVPRCSSTAFTMRWRSSSGCGFISRLKLIFPEHSNAYRCKICLHMLRADQGHCKFVKEQATKPCC